MSEEMAARTYVPKPAPSPKVQSYKQDVLDIVNYWVDRGYMTSTEAMASAGAAFDTAETTGYSTNLPYLNEINQYKAYIAPVQMSPEYEKLKDFTLRSKLTFSEKLNKLLRLEPQSGQSNVYSKIRQDVLASLSPEERSYVDTGEMSPALNRQYKERWSLEGQGMPFEDWLSVKTGYLSAEERAPFMQATPSTPTYQPSFEATKAGLTGSQYWKNWFTNRFYDVLQEYKTKGEQTEAGWSGFLAKRKAELKEEWWSLGAYGRGERPSSYQPPIKTVGF